MKKLILITGTSRGLGFHLANQFLDAGFTVIGIARSNSIVNSRFYFLKLDLMNIKNIQGKLNAFLKQKKIPLKNQYVVLINNAATVMPIDYFHKIKLSQIQESYRLNLLSPMILSSYLIQKFLARSQYFTICNISSGAAIRPMMNWSVYCTMKSGLKMVTDCLNVEYGDSKKFKAISFYPGTMDTEMQVTIRNQQSKKFKNVEVFKELKKRRTLLDPKVVSSALFNILKEPKQIERTEYSVSDRKAI